VTILALTPDTTISSAGWTVTGAGGDVDVALSDGSDLTWVTWSSGSGALEVGLSDLALPTDALILSYQIVLRAQDGVATHSHDVRIVFPGGDGELDSVSIPNTPLSAVVAPSHTTWLGAPLTDAMFDGASLRLISPGHAVSYTLAIVNVLVNEIPVVTVTAPTEGGSVTTTTRPTITWTFADPELEAQERYQYKIFTAAQYGVGGFDPETSPCTYDSGEVLDDVTSVVLPIDLDNGITYRVYVKAGDPNSGGRYSLWDQNTFTINVTAPPAPTLVVTAQPTNADGPRTKVDITRGASATPTTWMFIEYSDDAGATWDFLRNAEHIVNSPDGTTFTIYDYEQIPGVQRSYRAKAIRTV
jgi:hypothetical protein